MLPPLTRIDHVGIACRDLDAAIGRYEATFGLQVVSLEVNEEQGVREAMLAVGASGASGASGGDLRPGYVQLLEPLGPDTPVGRFLARRGEGLHHVGYGVQDIGQALDAIGVRGVRLLDERPR
ncbi:MAG TPA: VOC family protein, partial [Streptosporangiaceae bacterium]|nr:VOC family protein [Streptosporangiaceae bacterium]